MDFTNHPLSPQLSTTVEKALKTTVTTVPCKGTNYAKTDALFDSLGDLVNEDWKLWYYKKFYALGEDQVMRFASIARQEAKKDKRVYFSWMLKNPTLL